MLSRSPLPCPVSSHADCRQLISGVWAHWEALSRKKAGSNRWPHGQRLLSRPPVLMSTHRSLRQPSHFGPRAHDGWLSRWALAQPSTPFTAACPGSRSGSSPHSGAALCRHPAHVLCSLGLRIAPNANNPNRPRLRRGLLSHACVLPAEARPQSAPSGQALSSLSSSRRAVRLGKLSSSQVAGLAVQSNSPQAGVAGPPVRVLILCRRGPPGGVLSGRHSVMGYVCQLAPGATREHPQSHVGHGSVETGGRARY